MFRKLKEDLTERLKEADPKTILLYVMIFVLSSLLIAILRFDDFRLRKKPAMEQAAGAGKEENHG